MPKIGPIQTQNDPNLRFETLGPGKTGLGPETGLFQNLGFIPSLTILYFWDCLIFIDSDFTLETMYFDKALHNCSY